MTPLIFTSALVTKVLSFFFVTQSAFTCFKSTIKTLEQFVKSVQS